jgi:hypothetical protein
MLPWKPVASVKRNEERSLKISLAEERNDGGNKTHNSNQSEWHNDLCKTFSSISLNT